MDFLPQLAALDTPDLLALSRAVLRELRLREVIRSGNAPAGDYAEMLVHRLTGGALAESSQKSWDVLTPTGERLQVKARVVTDPNSPGQRQLSVFRSWDFDAAVVVLFDDDFAVWRASLLPVDVVETAGKWNKHVSGWRVLARNELLDRGDDWTLPLTSVSRPALP